MSSAPEPHAPGVDQTCLAHLLGYQLAQADIPLKKIFFKRIAEPFGLRPVEFTTLVLVKFNPGINGKQLAQTLAVTAANITLMLDKLSEKGLLARVRSETDRRAQNVHLTAAGEVLAAKAHEVSLTMEQDLLRHLSAGERVMLLELLQKLAKHRRV
ncbi:MarR family transcriptional regulator [Ideonella azotifigens]|uniref:MarR family transcriptional regulator n=1 Tax=Ideonella azotifigens TaxID=513160 RepID=A0ABN1JK79_9BURK|nr:MULTISPECIES: MarR family transcriptional regulator [Ideonella]MCD2341869.1 MarR family transcriptional regulator [Ideonella azotifigens]HSI49732.1 MarR family transcriptional regulator [Ideonella sp.]